VSSPIPASTAEKEAQAARLKDFFGALPDGEEVSWMRVEHDSGVKMDYAGRSMARLALKRLRRPYEAIKGTGLRMSSAGNSVTILAGRFARVETAIQKTDRVREALETRHFAQMSEVDQKKMLLAKSFFGALKVCSSTNEGRKFLGK